MRSVTTADFKQNTIVHVQESVSLHRNLLDSAGLTQNFRQAEEGKTSWPSNPSLLKFHTLSSRPRLHLSVIEEKN